MIEEAVDPSHMQNLEGSTMEVVQMMRLLQAVGQNSLATVAGLGDFAAFSSRWAVAAGNPRRCERDSKVPHRNHSAGSAVVSPGVERLHPSILTTAGLGHRN